MTNEQNLEKIRDAQAVLNRLFPLIDSAEKQFKSARNWGFIDIFGGGFIVDMIKHYKLGSVSETMNNIQALLQNLQSLISHISIPTDYSMNVGTFSAVADIVFDCVFTDVYMQSKIMSSLKQVQDLRTQLELLQQTLQKITEQHFS
ncbi:hypothetical protein H0R92_09050 [Treponema sp. OMZ 840]|uniref:hypothetical protein n=1 Tax=Treponema sp. OMZ 840 TaxID=244313 RepID=UPI003D91EB9F